MKSRTETVMQVILGVKAILSEIFTDADVESLELLYYGLSEAMADISLMRRAWLPDVEGDQEPLELDVELPLELEPSEPAEPKDDFTEAKGGPSHEVSE